MRITRIPKYTKICILCKKEFKPHRTNQKYCQNPCQHKQPLFKVLATKAQRYGMTLETLQKIYTEQEGKCRLCFVNVDIRQICVDHNHTTNKVRGLLCQQCNGSIGTKWEDLAWAKRAFQYVVYEA